MLPFGPTILRLIKLVLLTTERAADEPSDPATAYGRALEVFWTKASTAN
jgi:hypothetical protein